MNKTNRPLPGEQLLSDVRAGFVAQGTSLSRWCADNNVLRQNARLCLVGGWNGPKGQRLRDQIVRAATAVRPRQAA